MKPLLVGDSPGRTSDRYWELPLSGAVAQSLCQMAGIPPTPGESRYERWTSALYSKFDCINLIDRYPGGLWPAAQAIDAVGERIEDDREVVVFLGYRAHQAYQDSYLPAYAVTNGQGYFNWRTDSQSPTGRREVVAVPHPIDIRDYLHGTLDDRRDARRSVGRILREAIEKAKQLEETRL